MTAFLKTAWRAGFLVALRAKGETAEEIAGCAEAMRDHVVHETPKRADLVDTAAARIYGVADGQRIKDLRVLLPGSVVLPRAFASRRGVREGDRLTLETAQGRMGFTVRGYVQEPTKDTVPVRELFPRRICLRVSAIFFSICAISSLKLMSKAWTS